MAMNQFSPALLEVLDSANKINPVTPQGRPTIAANVMQQAGKPVQGLPGVLAQTQQAAPSVAENMQEQQFGQMLAKTQPQPPAMMAEGGIASLPMGDEDYDYEYADGGIIGYAGPDGSEVNLGGVSGIAYGSPGESEERERLNRLPLEYLQKLLDAIGAGGKKFVKGTTLESRPKKDEAAVQAGTTYQNPSLDPETGNLRGEPVIAPEGIAAALQQQRPPAPRTAPSQREGIAQVMPAAAKEPTFTGAAEEAMGVFKRPDDTRLRAEGERLRELQTQRPTSAAEMEANRIAREKQRAQYEEISGRDTGLGELMSVLGGISRRTGALEGLEGYRTKRDTAAAKETEAARLFAQQQSLLEQKDYANKVGDIKASMEIEQALIKNREEYNKAMIPASASAYSTKARQVSDAAEIAARAKEGAAGRTSAERIAGMRAEGGIDTASQRLYDTINDNAAKQMDEWLKTGANKYATPAVVAAQRAQFVTEQLALAKQMGHKMTPEMEALIKKSSTQRGTRENPINLD